MGFLVDPKVGVVVFAVAVVIAVIRRGGDRFWSWKDTTPAQGAFIALCAVGVLSFGLDIVRQMGLLGIRSFNYDASQKLEPIVSAKYDNQTVTLTVTILRIARLIMLLSSIRELLLLS
jgi:hypothetical protein